MPKILELSGKKFGNLTVLEKVGLYRTPGGQTRNIWRCQCDCGNFVNRLGYELKNDVLHSCGCQRRERCANLGRSSRKPPGISTTNRLFYECQEGAKKRKLEFEIDKVLFLEIIAKNCHYCGRPPRKINARGGTQLSDYQKEQIVFCNGIDRIDSSVGYTKSNIVPCCKTCNIAKNNLTVEEFLEWIETIYKFQHNKAS